jgi:hypothetical protein
MYTHTHDSLSSHTHTWQSDLSIDLQEPFVGPDQRLLEALSQARLFNSDEVDLDIEVSMLVSQPTQKILQTAAGCTPHDRV